MADTKESRYNEVIHNIHVHLFTLDHIPKYFVSRYLSTEIAKTVAKTPWLKKLSFFFFRGMLNRYMAFLYSSLQRSQKEVLEELRAYYPKSSKFSPLCIDFEFMEAGPTKVHYLQQLEELAALKANFPDVIYPFIGIDPRREGLLDLVQEYIEQHKFTGLKVYPALGFFPDDERLHPVYAYAEEKQLPITVHCIPKNANHYRGKITAEMIDKARQVPGFDEKETRKAYDFAMYWNHPYWYKVLLQTFPKLKINFGHFGGNEEWDKYLDTPFRPDSPDQSWYKLIRDLIRDPQYPNIYADISFTVYDYKLFPVLKNLMNTPAVRDYVLFGSDFYMLQKDYRERRFGFDVRGYLDDEAYWRLADANPRRFLSTAFQDLRG